MINRYNGRCFRCSNQVAAGEGIAERPAGQAWRVRHNDGACPATLVAPPAHPTMTPAARELVGEGYYLMNGSVYNVARSQSSQRLYARRLVVNGNRGRWSYERGAYFHLTDDMNLTVAEAARLGHLHGVCMVCGRTLTDPVSVENGIGPVCMGRLRRREAERNSGVLTAAREIAGDAGASAPYVRARQAVADELSFILTTYRAAQQVAQVQSRQLSLDELGQGEVL